MRTGPALAAMLLLLAATPPVSAWTRQNQIDIAWEAARLAPPDLWRQIVRNKLAFRDGLLEPFGDAVEAHHEKNPDGSGLLDEVIELQAERSVASIVAHRPMKDVVYQMGVLLHHLIEANDPLAASAGDASEARYREDFGRYMESVLPRLPLVFYGIDRELRDPADVRPFVERTLSRSRGLYPSIGYEYRRVGWQPGKQAFDDKSTAFGVVAVCFNRALSDSVAMLRYVWLEAGGRDTLPRLGLESKRLLKLPRSP